MTPCARDLLGLLFTLGGLRLRIIPNRQDGILIYWLLLVLLLLLLLLRLLLTLPLSEEQVRRGREGEWGWLDRNSTNG